MYSAYLLAADPSWITYSVSSYYDFVDEIIVSFDVNKVGWSGVPVSTDVCLGLLKSLDKRNKMKFVGDSFYKPELSNREQEIFQRQHAVAACSSKAEWIINLDSDEVIPKPESFFNHLSKQVDKDVKSINWPFRVIFQHLNGSVYLEVCDIDRKSPTVEFPGSIAVRKDVIFDYGRTSLQKQKIFHVTDRPWIKRLIRWRSPRTIIPMDEAILHFSWVRSVDQMWEKVRSWGHREDFDTENYVKNIWQNSVGNWEHMQNFHPLNPNWWPALRPINLEYKAEKGMQW